MLRRLAAEFDVTGHEVAHGVTAATSNLLYAYQSGAINEALSDDEVIDLGVMVPLATALILVNGLDAGAVALEAEMSD